MTTTARNWNDMILETIDGNVILETPLCMHCGHLGTVSVTSAELADLKAGTPIQEALPAYSDAYREQIISGYHPACWNELFGA